MGQVCVKLSWTLPELPNFEGKTLILEAAAKTLSERENTDVVFIMALGELFIEAEIQYFFLIFLHFQDYDKKAKKSDDILDIMFRWNSFHNLKNTF